MILKKFTVKNIRQKVKKEKFDEINEIFINLIRIAYLDDNPKKDNKEKKIKKIINEKPEINYLNNILRQKLPINFIKNMIDFLNIEKRNNLEYFLEKHKIRIVNKILIIKQINKIFKENHVRFLILKGIPLANTLYGNSAARISNDIDLLVDPKDLFETITFLYSNNFTLVQKIDLETFPEWKKKYLKWVDYSIVFQKKINQETIEIDLHWHLSNTRDKLPNFEQIWERKKTVYIDGIEVFTLNNYDNFLHLCIHAAKDRWMNQGNLLEIFFLSNKLSKFNIKEYGGISFVRQSAIATDFLLGDFYLTKNLKTNYREFYKYSKLSYSNQILPKNFIEKDDKRFFFVLNEFFKKFSITNSPIDWLRIISFKLVRPENLYDIKSSKYLSLKSIIFRRMKEFKKRFL